MTTWGNDYRRGAALFAGMMAIAPMNGAWAQGAQENPETLELKTITVDAESDDTLVQDGYIATQSRAGTKVNTPILQIPQSVTVITQDQIEDQAPRTLNEALEYTASANSNTYGFDTRQDAFFLRGFRAQYDAVFRDGLRQFNGPSAWFKTEPYGIEGVTILKGPGASLYGVSGSGGIVNLVTKRPKEETYREVEVSVGSNDRYQTGFDFSGPANDSGTILYRLTGMGRLADTDVPGYSDDKLYLAPAVTFKPNENTKLTILSEYSEDVTGGNATFNNPIRGYTLSSTYEADPDWNKRISEQARIGYEFEHRFDDILTVRQNMRFSLVDLDMKYSGTGYYGHYREDAKSFVLDNMAQFDFNTGHVRHIAIVGADYSWSDYSSDIKGGVSISGIEKNPFNFEGSQRWDVVGLYLHDQMEWNNFTVFANARYDWVTTKSQDRAFTKNEQKDSAFSYRVGASYKTPWGITPYANYSVSFSPNVGFIDVSPTVSEVASPTIGTQKEIGVKYEIPGYNTLLSAALFDIDQVDGVVFDAASGVNTQRQLDLRSRGLEIEANASFDNGFGLIASYTFLKMEIENGVPGTVGKELSSTPNHTVSLWGHYEFDHGTFAGVGLGAGIRHLSSSEGNDKNEFQNSARTFIDGALSYDFGHKFPELRGVSLQVNAKNLFNERKKNCGAGYCYRDEGRTVFATLRFNF